jgi:hypothetical protein
MYDMTKIFLHSGLCLPDVGVKALLFSWLAVAKKKKKKKKKLIAGLFLTANKAHQHFVSLSFRVRVPKKMEGREMK